MVTKPVFYIVSARPSKSTGRKISDLDVENSKAIQIGSQRYAHVTPDQHSGIWPVTQAQGGVGGYPQVFPERFPTIDLGDLTGSYSIDIDLNKFFAHVTKFKLVGASPITQTITISKPPPIGLSMLFFVEVEQDANGGHNVNWPTEILPTPIIDTNPNAKTLVALFTDDNGLTFHQQVFGASGAGGEFSNPATEDLDMNNHSIVGINTLQGFNSSLQKIMSKTSGWDFEVPDGDGFSFYVDRANNPSPRFQIGETVAVSTVDLEMNQKKVRAVGELDFGQFPYQSWIDTFSSGLRLHNELNRRFAFEFGSGVRFDIDDLLRLITMVGMDLVMTGGKTLRVEDTITTRNIQLQNLFGNQKIIFTDRLQLDHGINTRMEIDSTIKPLVDLDMGFHQVKNVGNLQIPEAYGSGGIPIAATDTAILFCRPNASTGKTELRILFQSGASKLIISE